MGEPLRTVGSRPGCGTRGEYDYFAPTGVLCQRFAKTDPRWFGRENSGSRRSTTCT